MRVMQKGDLLVLAPDDEADTRLLDGFAGSRQGHVLRLLRSGRGMQLTDLGDEDTARNTPINVHSRSPEPFDLISNFAHTPFRLDGRNYASVEGFWQGLKFEGRDDRLRVAMLFGNEAKFASEGTEKTATFDYNGSTIRAGTYDHWQLMHRACKAKFKQNEPARAALLATGNRPLIHKVRHDSRTIPGVIMAEIWMGLRTIFSQASE